MKALIKQIESFSLSDLGIFYYDGDLNENGRRAVAGVVGVAIFAFFIAQFGERWEWYKTLSVSLLSGFAVGGGTYAYLWWNQQPWAHSPFNFQKV